MITTANLEVDRLRTLASRVPYPSRELSPLALALTTHIAQHDTQSPAAIKATWRTWHALRLAEAGRRAEALATSEEAITLRRELAAGNRDAYLPNLATSLWMAAEVCLMADGHTDHAVETATEAVAIFEILASDEPASYADQLHAAAEALATAQDKRGETQAAAEVRARFDP